MLQTINLLGVKVSRTNLVAAKDQICQWVKERTLGYVCVAPASTLVEARTQKEYCDVINQALMVTPDGMPVVWLAKMKGCSDIERTYGPDLMRLLCQEKGLRHFFYGSTTHVIDILSAQLKSLNPDIQIAGLKSPKFRSQVELEQENTIKEINAANADILWVGLGSPKQDFWMAMHRPLLHVPIMVGVGAAFDFIAGTKPQAPRWMQQSGLEWAFRLCSEPKRLWRRYLIGNVLFIYFAIQDLWFKPR